MSIAFLLERQEDAVIWRGPLKMNVLRQLLADVEWGELDYLICDLPPGTGDEPLSLCQLMSGPDGGIVVTTPQEVALSDVRKSIDFCRKLNLPVIGVVENMSEFICPNCGARYNIFGRDGGRKMSGEMGVPFLGSIPLEPGVVQACDSGTMNMEHFKESGVAEAFGGVVEKVRAFCES
jgi:Mrp family chromosome partitioning ATPase